MRATLKNDEFRVVRHLLLVIQLRPHRGYVMCYGQHKICIQCEEEGHIAAYCALTHCYRCNGRGHRASNCQEKIK